MTSLLLLLLSIFCVYNTTIYAQEKTINPFIKRLKTDLESPTTRSLDKYIFKRLSAEQNSQNPTNHEVLYDLVKVLPSLFEKNKISEPTFHKVLTSVFDLCIRDFLLASAGDCANESMIEMRRYYGKKDVYLLLKNKKDFLLRIKNPASRRNYLAELLFRAIDFQDKVIIDSVLPAYLEESLSPLDKFEVLLFSYFSLDKNSELQSLLTKELEKKSSYTAKEQTELSYILSVYYKYAKDLTKAESYATSSIFTEDSPKLKISKLINLATISSLLGKQSSHLTELDVAWESLDKADFLKLGDFFVIYFFQCSRFKTTPTNYVKIKEAFEIFKKRLPLSTSNVYVLATEMLIEKNNPQTVSAFKQNLSSVPYFYAQIIEKLILPYN